jgi:hypothetical protein
LTGTDSTLKIPATLQIRPLRLRKIMNQLQVMVSVMAIRSAHQRILDLSIKWKKSSQLQIPVALIPRKETLAPIG